MGRKKIKVTRRSRNEGNIRLREDGLYEARVTLGTDPNGKQIQKSLYSKDKAKLIRRMNETILSVYKGTYVEDLPITLEVWINKWLNDYAKFNVKETTLEVYKIYTKNHIIPELGFHKLSSLKTANIQAFINKLSDKGLSPGTIIYVMRILKGALKQAVLERMLNDDVSKHCVLPKDKHKEMKILKPEDLTAFIKEAKNDRFYALFMLELATGIRRGEMLGLRWQDINFKEGYIQLHQQVVIHKNKLLIKDLKTTYSNRKLYLPEDVLHLLELHKKVKNRKRKGVIELDTVKNNNDLVFKNIYGGVMHPKNLLRSFRRILEKTKLEKIRFHDLRHTYALNCLQQGIDIKTLQENLGHHKASFTIEKYGHSTAEMKKDAAKRIGNFLNEKIK